MDSSPPPPPLDLTSSNTLSVSSSSSPIVQDSPFSKYLSNLSPINPVNRAHEAQGFSGLNVPSPLPVFTSPRINLKQDMNFIRRLGYSQSSTADLPLERRGSIANPELMNGLTPSTQKECLNKGLEQGQPLSPSECIDEYLADTMEMGSAANDAFSLCPNQKNDTARSLPCASSRTKNDNEKHDDDGGTKEDMKNVFVPQFTSLDLDEVEVHEKPLHRVESDKQQDDCEGPSMEGASMISEKADGFLVNDFSLVPASGELQCQQLLSDSFQVIPVSENHDELLGERSTESVEDRSQLDSTECGLHPHGTRRRCLQFEIVEAHKNAETVRSLSNIVNIVSISSSGNPTELKMLDSSLLDSSVLPSDADLAQYLMSPSSNSSLYSLEMPGHDKCDTAIRNSARTSLKAPKPSGIGLHLNSIVSAAAVCRDAAPDMKTKSYPTAQREISLSVAKLNSPETPSATSVPSSLTRKNEDYVESTGLVSESTANTHSPQRRADKVEDFNQMSPQRKRQVHFSDKYVILFFPISFLRLFSKKRKSYSETQEFVTSRKKASYTIESQGCKRCNCKRSKCLKLYCECFAAGIYCAEPCACVECFNKPEYEDTVLETRQQIESRNPLAFAPRVVRRVTGSPAQVVEDGGRATPTSARHKRGCNCKKSKCLKKYCECYQAGVGCSVGCRCDGCKNIYGIKEGHGKINEIECKKSDDETWEDPADRKMNITPQTPSLLSSNHGKKFSKSRDLARQFFPSPESDNNTSSSSTGNPLRTPRTFSSHDDRIKVGNSSLDVRFDQELACDTTLTVDQFSHSCNELEDSCDLMPLLAPPSSVATSSSVSNTKECPAIARLQLHSSIRLSGSFRLHAGSVTPIHHLGGSELQQKPGTHGGYCFTEDDTPEILKDSSTPIKAIKANSPNRKRVSPPHSRFNELRPSSSPSLRSGRKFVLQSIPSFPPLTPYSDPKGGTGK
ncbi:hypothetical protein Sjap_011307 [Stephania japonica]|uniref:CRC domain-containing protein n=1 Tax=Stephania japonica TaxID=461633 RepID=A0AAP0JC64_9MAGN